MTSGSDNLPEVLELIAAAAGYDVALKIARDFGGSRVYLPRDRVRPDSALAQSVGVDAAQKVVEALGHGELMVPLGPRRHGARLRLAIAELLQHKVSPNRIARQLGITERTVKRHKARILRGRCGGVAGG